MRKINHCKTVSQYFSKAYQLVHEVEDVNLVFDDAITVRIKGDIVRLAL